MLLPGACGAGGSDANRTPRAPLSQTRAAEAAFRALERDWLSRDPGARLELEPALRDFLRRFGSDPSADVVRVYWAFVLVERGALLRAGQLLVEVQRRGVGATHDYAELVHAAILIRRGEPERATALLERLDRRLVDAEQRLVHAHLSVSALTAAGQYARAVVSMRDWLALWPLERGAQVQENVVERLDALPTSALLEGLSELAPEAGDKTAHENATRWLVKRLRDRLFEVASAARDETLAKALLAIPRPELLTSVQRAALSRVAVGGRVAPRVAGRFVGLALSLGSTRARTRSAEVARGLMRGLGLPASESEPGAVRLVTRDDAGDAARVPEVLAALAGEGAVVVVAGVDAESAVAAARFAESAAIPVLLVFDVPAGAGGSFAFNVAPRPNADVTQLSAALEQRDLTWSAVGGEEYPCDDSGSGSLRHFPVAEWKQRRVESLLLLGDEACARRVVEEARAAAFRPLFALGFEAAALYRALEGRPHLSIGAGAFPDRLERREPLRTPGWYELMAADAGTLVKRALVRLPPQRVDDARLVSRLHRLARDELRRAEADLSTTERRGFDAEQRLPRTLRVVESAENP
ncbi:MAG TPA: DUF2379 family protein [Polyangiaceae bacterium]